MTMGTNKSPPASHWWPRFVWGLTRPFVLLFRLRQEPLAFRAWALTFVVQGALTLIAGSVLFVRDLEKNEPTARKQARREAQRDAQRDLRRAVDEARDAGVDLSALQQLIDQVPELTDEAAPAKKKKHPNRDQKPFKPGPRPRDVQQARDVLGLVADAGWPVGLLHLDEALAQLEDAGVSLHGALRVDLARGDGGASDDDDVDDADEALAEAKQAAAERAERIESQLADAAEAVKDASAELEKAEEDAEFDFWKRLALWASSLVLAQSVLLAFTRDYHDRTARDLSLVACLDPEDLPKNPGVRIDLKWLWRKLRRRLRGFLTTAAGVVALSPVIVLGGLFSNTDRVISLVVGVVSVYWWVVFTGARSARAWRTEDDLTPPTPLRALSWVTTTVPGFRWFGPKWLLRFALWGSKSMFAPARAIERDLPAFVGLALARVVGSIPVIRIGLRAALVVAAGELLEATADEEDFDLRIGEISQVNSDT